MKITETILARGHKNIQATHKTTFEVTKEKEMSRKGDCIIAVSANKALADLASEFKKKLQQDNVNLTILIEAGDVVDVITASGNSKLILTHPMDMVVRKSGYICNRTLAIRADKAAYDLSRKLVERLRKPKQKVRITLKLII